MNEHAHTVSHGAIGVIGPILGIIASAMPQLEMWLRILSLIVGISVGVLSMVRLCQGRK